MKQEIRSIGFVHTDAGKVPRHWMLSDLEGILDIDKEYTDCLRDIKVGQRIVVIFMFHKSPDFTSDFIFQRPPHREEKLGVFSTCSPIRPNPLGMSVVEVLDRKGNKIYVKGIDMIDGTPVLDIKPHVANKLDLPSYSPRL